MNPKIIEDILLFIDKLHEETKEKIDPIYPYNKDTNKIDIPMNIQSEIVSLIESGKKPVALKKVTRLTGAGLRVSKDYIDNLFKNRKSKIK